MSNKKKFLIGVDTSVEERLDTSGAPDNANVYVEVQGGKVHITGPLEDWVGRAVLARLDSDAEAEALARRIAANPTAELPALGYDIVHWFRPTA